jgi:hypothetical protein
MGALLIGIGVLLFLLALGLAFTIFGVISAFVGMACIVVGVLVLGHKSKIQS